jgi:hypothetical protein
MPFTVSASLRASGSGYSYLDPGGASASFTVYELFILGPDNIPLSDARYIAGSNHDYGFINAALIPVPEPSTAGLLLLGCCAGRLARLLHRISRHGLPK